ILAERKWDVILVDGPQGYKPQHPGRALPIWWAAQLRSPHTHVFVDDYNRPLEQSFADLLLGGNSGKIVLPNEKRKGSMLWSMGVSPAFQNRQHAPVEESTSPFTVTDLASRRVEPAKPR